MLVNQYLNTKGPIEFTIIAKPWPQDITELPYSGIYQGARHIARFIRNIHLFTWNPRLRIWVEPINQGTPLRYGGNKEVRNVAFPIYDTRPYDIAAEVWPQQVQMFVNCFNSIPNHHLIFVVISHSVDTVFEEFKPLLRSIGIPAADLEYSAQAYHVMAGFKGTPEGQAFINIRGNEIINDVMSTRVTFKL